MRLVGPAVKHLIQQYGINSSKLPAGTGRNGVVLKGDILKYVQDNKLQAVKEFDVKVPILTGVGPIVPVTPAKYIRRKKEPFIDIELTSMRRTIAKRLLESKSSIPHAYATVNSSLENVMNLRKKIQALGVSVSMNDFVIKCTANALARCPQINVVWAGEQLQGKSQIDISVAVATKAGLLTPIVQDAGGKDIIQISETVKTLAAKAKDGKLQPQEFMGGTFTISNLGMFGISHFTAIINPPQCAILAVGGGYVQVGSTGELYTTMKLSLSYDGRAILEEKALEFLAQLRYELENVNETGVGLFSLDDDATLYRYSSSQSSTSSAAKKK